MEIACVDPDAERAKLADAIALGQGETHPRARFRLARALLRDRAMQALDGTAGAPLAETLQRAEGRPNTPALRALGVLLVQALGVPNLIDAGYPAIQRYLEQVLHHPLHRARYPFEGSAEAKRACLERLHVSLAEHMRPFEPSIPLWISGNRP